MPDLTKKLKDAVNAGLGLLGVRLTSTALQPWHPTLASGLRRLAALDLPIHTLIDVGAANGAWSREASAALPRIRDFLLIEAQAVHRPALDRFCTDFPQAHVALAVAGPAPGIVSFDANNPWDGAASSRTRTGGTWTPLAQTSLDHEVAKHHLAGGYLIKLDVHGFERPILAGAATILPHTEALIVECYNFELGDEAQRFPAFCLHMESLGFRCADLWDPSYIGPDNMLWQFDLLFLRQDRVRRGDRTRA